MTRVEISHSGTGRKSEVCTLFAPRYLPALGFQRWVLAELRPLFLPAQVVLLVVHVRAGASGWQFFGDAMGLWCWWLYKGHGDDRWKRRRKKVAEKVKALASGRLVAVPT